MAKLASKHRTSNLCSPTSKHVFDSFSPADVQNVLAEHEMFEKFGGGETSKSKDRLLRLAHVRQTMLVSFARPLHGIGYVQILMGSDPLCLHETGSKLERYSSI